jgi:hypothetical protein
MVSYQLKSGIEQLNLYIDEMRSKFKKKQKKI